MAEGPSAADENLLYVVLALRTGFLTREALIEGVESWLADPSRPLSSVLIDRGGIDPAVHPLIERMVERHYQRTTGGRAGHDDGFRLNDPLPELLETLADPDLQASLSRLQAAQTSVGPGSSPPADWGATTAWVPTEPALGSTPAAAGPPDPPAGRPDPAPPPARFRYVRPHAVGGLGEVHVAWDEELGREVALKEIRPRFADEPRARSRFVREAEVTGNLDHPGVVPVYSLGTYADGRPYYAMRFVHGETLQDAIDREYRGDPGAADPAERAGRLRRLLRRFIDICDTIEYAHGRGVLHRDLKPANILIGSHGEALIIDWGLAKVLGKAEAGRDDPGGAPQGDDPADGRSSTVAEPLQLHSSLGGSIPTVDGETLGSPPFMSPEQARGLNDELDRTTDVYSLGATLFAVLTGRPPVRPGKTPEVLARVIRGEIIPPAVANPGVHPALAAVCLKAMGLDPSRRYPTARALADDVQRWLDDQPVSVYSDPPATRVFRWARRHRTLVATSLALTLATVVGLALTTAVVNDQRRRAVADRKAAEEARAATETALLRAVEAEETSRDIAYNFLEVITLADSRVFTRMRPADREKFLAAGVRFAEVYRDVAGGDPVARLRAAEVAMRLATLYRVKGRFDEAIKLYADGVAVLERLAGGPDPAPEHVDRLCEALIEQGDAWQTLGRAGDAERAFGRASDLAAANLERHDRLAFRRTLGRALARRASAGLDLGRADAPEVAARAVAALRPVADASNSVVKSGQIIPHSDQFELAQALANEAEGQARAGRTDGALRLFREASARADRLARTFRGPNRVDIDYNQAWFAVRLARALAEHGGAAGRAEAIEVLDAAVATLQKIQSAESPAVSHRTALADALNARARVRLLDSGHDAAHTDARTAQLELEPLRKTNPGVVELMTLHAEALDLLSRAALGLGPESAETARAHAREAVEVQTAAVDANPADPAARARLAEYRSRLK